MNTLTRYLWAPLLGAAAAVPTVALLTEALTRG